MELKVGDKVKLRNRLGCVGSIKDEYSGKIVTISRIVEGLFGYKFTIEEDTYPKLFFNMDDIECIIKQKHFKSLPNNYTGTIEVENGFIKEILDETEKRYLKAVIRPFKNKVVNISKRLYFNGKCYIEIELDTDNIRFPFFEPGAMYNGMKENKKYTLKELGLDE